jgi:hypothetical protein
MSATGRGAVREKDDFYETPAWCTSLILDALTAELGISPMVDTVLDPFAGRGAILDVATARRFRTIGIEIDADRSSACESKPRESKPHCVRCADALSETLRWVHPDDGNVVIVTNPPYRLAMQCVDRAIKEARGSIVAMLLRLNWLASQRRAAWHRAHPSHVYVLPRRPSFTEDGHTDACEYAWFVWYEGVEARWSIL